MSKFNSIFSAAGFKLPFFGKGRSPLLSANVNDLVRALNQLGRITVKRNPAATDDKVFYADAGMVFELALRPNENGGSITVREIDGTPEISGVNTIEFTNGTVTDAGGGIAQITIASGGLTQMRVKSKSGDVLTCRTWDGTTEGGSDIRVATNRESRQLSSETINSVTYTYSSYTAIDSYNDSRSSSDGSNVEIQIVTPMWYSNCIIMVANCDYSGVSYSGSDIKYIEVSSRCWAWDDYP